MRIGLGVFLVALGAILVYATSWHIHGLNLHTTGGIMMAAGVALAAFSIALYHYQRHGSIVTRTRRLEDDPLHPGEIVYEESSDIDRPVGDRREIYDELIHPGRPATYPPSEAVEEPPGAQSQPGY